MCHHHMGHHHMCHHHHLFYHHICFSVLLLLFAAGIVIAVDSVPLGPGFDLRRLQTDQNPAEQDLTKSLKS